MDWKNKDEVRAYMREYKKTHETNKKYYQAHKEEKKAKDKEYRKNNAEKLKAYQKEYRKNNAEKLKTYRKENKEKRSEYNKKYYREHKESELKRITEYNKEYSKTQMGRAQNQIQTYKLMDEKNGFGKDKIDFNARWIVENIYTKPCPHCGETDWHKLGCNRLDNSKPHTIDNVEPCCFHCNCTLNGKEQSERISQWAVENLKRKERPEISERLKGKKRPDISSALTGRKLSDEHKENIRNSMLLFRAKQRKKIEEN